MRYFSQNRMLTPLLVFLIVFPLASLEIETARADSPPTVQTSAVTSPKGFEGMDVNKTFQVNGETPGGEGGWTVEENIAAGPGHVMEVLQNVGQIFYKSTSTTQNFNLNKIFTLETGCSGTQEGDARVLFDPTAGSGGRWFAAAINQRTPVCGGQHWGDIAVSPTNDPSTFLASPPNQMNWYDLHTTGGWDHPEIAVTGDKLVFTSAFPTSLLVFNKNDLVNHFVNPVTPGFQDLSWQIPSLCGGGQPYPVRNLSPTTIEYLVCTPLTNPSVPYAPSTMYLFYINGTAQSGTPNASCCAAVSQTAPFPITTIVPSRCCINSSDGHTNSRPYAIVPALKGAPYCPNNPNPPYCYVPLVGDFSAVWSNNYLWLAEPEMYTFPDQSQWDSIRLVQLTTYANPTINPPTIDQSRDLNQEGIDFYMPSLSMDGLNDLAVSFAYSSPGLYPSIAITGQGFTNVTANLTPWKTLKAGGGYDTNYTATRFSDFSGAASDPSDPTLLWVVGAYYTKPTCGNDSAGRAISCWASWVASMRVVGLSIWATPGSLTVNPGATGSTNVTIQAQYGFSGKVNVTAGISPQLYGGPTASVSRSSVQVGLGASNYTLANVDASTVTAPGPYSLYVTAQTPDLSVTLAIPATVPYFDFTGVNPSTLAYVQGTASTVSSTITLTSRFGFAGPVSLSTSAPSGYGIAVSLSGPTVTLASGGSASFSASVSTSTSTPGGTYQVTVTGSSGSYSQFVYVTVKVGSYYCTATASPTSGRLSVTVSFSVTCLAGVSSVTWSFNDGSGATSTAQNTTYTYSWEVGGGSFQRFSPTVTVKDGDMKTYYPGVPVITLTCTNGCPTRPSP